MAAQSFVAAKTPRFQGTTVYIYDNVSLYDCHSRQLCNVYSAHDSVVFVVCRRKQQRMRINKSKSEEIGVNEMHINLLSVASV